MSGSKATVRLIATLMFLSMGVVLYPQGSAVRSQAIPYSTPATADRYCAKPSKETEPPDCSFSNINDCRASFKGKGRWALLQAIALSLIMVEWLTA
jgi:hypothetical protein